METHRPARQSLQRPAVGVAPDVGVGGAEAWGVPRQDSRAPVCAHPPAGCSAACARGLSSLVPCGRTHFSRSGYCVVLFDPLHRASLLLMVLHPWVSKVLRFPDYKGFIFNVQFGKTLRMFTESLAVLADRDNYQACAVRRVAADIAAIGGDIAAIGWELVSGRLFAVGSGVDGNRGLFPLIPA